MNKKIVIFYSHEDMRVDRIGEAAEKAGVTVEKINTRKLLLKNSKAFYDGRELQFDNKDIHWMVGFPYIARNLSFLLKLEGITLYPLIYDVVYDLDDKFIAHCFFEKFGIPTLNTIWLTPGTMEQAIDSLGGFPLIIKTTLGSTGTSVEIVRSRQDILDFVQKQLEFNEKIFNKKLAYILQEYITENNGEDYRVLCVKNKCLGVIKRKAKEGFKSNVSLGGSAEHVTNRPDLEEMALKIMEKSRLFMGGIDFIDTNDGTKAIEINASPQFEGFERATGIDVATEVMSALLK